MYLPLLLFTVKFRYHTGQNIAWLKLQVEHYVNNHVQINQDVSSNTNNFCKTYSLSTAIVSPSRKNKYLLQDFRNPWISNDYISAMKTRII